MPDIHLRLRNKVKKQIAGYSVNLIVCNELTEYKKEVNIMLGMKLTSFFSYMPNNLWEDSQHCKKVF